MLARMETKTYTGSCHCGAVRFEVEMALPETLIACNCSMCGRMGWLLAFVPDGQFKLLSGEGALRDYQFAKHHIHHEFCGTCGVRSFGHGKNPDGSGETYSVNVRCLDDNDELLARPVHHYDGRSL